MSQLTATVVDPGVTQRQASDPTVSAWVAASAGTGKTKVLTDRVLNLMLAGTEPGRVLCLTFTKAAAAEMRDRIASRLSDWAVMDDGALAAEITDLIGHKPKPREQERARQMFAQVLDAPGGLNIQTIHSFCQSLLSRFPLEAGVVPHFTVLEERDSRELLDDATRAVLSRAERQGGLLAAALAEVTCHLDQRGFREIADALIAQRERIGQLIARHGTVEAVILELFDLLALDADASPERIIAAACAEGAFDREGLRQTVDILFERSRSNGHLATIIDRWLLATEAGRRDCFADHCRAFLTGIESAEPRVRSRLVASTLTERYPFLAVAITLEAERLLAVELTRRRAISARATAALLRLGDAALHEYRRLKEARAVLDYHDLILIACRLLEQAGISSWVMYKLDAGIDHLLIDEAQDTSPAQWRIVRALTREFFADQAGRGRRSVFAVGDVKQSIYSFQDADPREFIASRDRFRAQVEAAACVWRPLALDTSFRSTTAILAAVDAVFANPAAARGVALDGLAIRHRVSAKRQGDGGLVEVWPTLGARLDDPGPDWKPPVEQQKQDSAELRLAGLIARRIARMVRDGEMLASHGRPIVAGDIMVLVQRRRAFAVELVRALKEYGIAVAGVDRLVLSEHIAVMDLVALGRFVLLPTDDLTLATVLKGPLIGLDDDDLLAIAHDRPGSLWPALRQRSHQDHRFATAVATLADLLAIADLRPPFDFYMHVLMVLGGRARLLARLGPEAEEPVAEFLDLALAYERSHPPSLQGFLQWFETGKVEIKRDLEQSDVDAVRIMTVHGAKGLQAPIVFLPDTVRAPSRTPKPELYWHGKQPANLLWPTRAHCRESLANAECDRWRQAQEEEYGRLLYVAMTRAEDRLIICGWRNKKQRDGEPDGCWYSLIRSGLLTAPEDLALEQADDPFLAAAPEFDGVPRVLRVRCEQRRIPDKSSPARPAGAVPLPAWATTRPPPELPPLSPLTPSRPEDTEPPIRPPIAAGTTRRFRRGRLIHRLLQTLPTLPSVARPSAARRWLARPVHGLPADSQSEIADEVLRVLSDPGFASLFGAGSMAEVPITGAINGRAVAGQIDRLVIGQAVVEILDYKTDRPPPDRPEAVAAIYLRQMAAYRAVLQAIYPGHAVRCSLLWTDGPTLMPLADRLLDPYTP